MSGLCGLVHLDGSPVDLGELERMAEALVGVERCRVELAVDGEVGFAHAALPSTGASEGGGLALRGALRMVAELRVDNRDELIAALARGDAAPMADADLLLAAREALGDGWERHLRGAFAAALWDAADRTLTLLRDPTGERALYWCLRGSTLLFASEPVQLLASGRLRSEVDRRRLLAHLLGSLPEPEWSFFEEVRRLPEGHRLVARQGGVRVERYWDWREIPVHPRQPAMAAEELLAHLQRAVARRLATAGETGVLLSGGLDSSAVATEAARRLAADGRRLFAFTWTSELGDGIDETARSRLLIGASPNVVEHPVPADGLAPLSRYPEAYSDPNDPAASTYPDLLLTTLEQARARGVAVLMNGVGGDPVAGGLVPDLALLRQGELAVVWRRWRREGWRRSALGYQLRARLRHRLPVWLTPYGRELARDAGLDRQILPWRSLASRRRCRLAAVTAPANVGNLERFERWSRRSSVRLVAPWHDADLVAFVFSLPGHAMEVEPPVKRLVRQAMAGRLPPPLLEPLASDPPRLARKGLLNEGVPKIVDMLSLSRLESLQLVDAKQARADFQVSVRAAALMPRLWELVTAESWLRTAPASDCCR